MRTTVDLPGHLFRAAKAEAAARGETLKELLTRALTNELGRAVGPRQPGRRVQLPLIKGTSGRKIDLTNEQIEEILAEEEAALPREVPPWLCLTSTSGWRRSGATIFA